LGENGAGKSTLMNVLAGVVAPDAGTIELAGAPFAPKGPLDARARGVAMIHQELAQAPHLTVAENVFLGREPARRFWLGRARMRGTTRDVLRRLGHDEIDPGARAGALAPAARQVVEIARALAFEARVLIMDEPTSSLGPAECLRLFGVVREVAAGGAAGVFISHSFRGVRAVAPRFTAPRGGAPGGRGDLAAASGGQRVSSVAGRWP